MAERGREASAALQKVGKQGPPEPLLARSASGALSGDELETVLKWARTSLADTTGETDDAVLGWVAASFSNSPLAKYV